VAAQGSEEILRRHCWGKCKVLSTSRRVQEYLYRRALQSTVADCKIRGTHKAGTGATPRLSVALPSLRLSYMLSWSVYCQNRTAIVVFQLM
jgi:hypothetical protein